MLTETEKLVNPREFYQNRKLFFGQQTPANMFFLFSNFDTKLLNIFIITPKK